VAHVGRTTSVDDTPFGIHQHRLIAAGAHVMGNYVFGHFPASKLAMQRFTTA